jgi:hypothetical protein
VDAAGDLFIAIGDTYGGDCIREVASSALTVTVDPAPLTVTGLSAADKSYDGTTAATLDTAGASLSGVLSGDSVSLDLAGATATFATANAGDGTGDGISVAVAGLSLAGPQAGDYTVVPPSLAADIDPAPLAVTADDTQKVSGDPDPTFTASCAGFVNGEGPGSLGGTLTFSTDEPEDPTTAAPGTYEITPAGLTSGNYAITFVPGTLTVYATAGSTATVGASSGPANYGDTVTLSATVSPTDGTTGTPSGSVDFFDTSTDTDLGSSTLAGGTASLSTSDLGLGPDSGDTNRYWHSRKD